MKHDDGVSRDVGAASRDVAAPAAAAVVFPAVVVGGVMTGYKVVWLVLFPSQTEFPGGKLPQNFVVALEDPRPGAAARPFRIVRAKHLTPEMPKRSRLRLSEPAYEHTTGNHRGFEVLDDGAPGQTVRTWERNMQRLDSRYRVQEDRIQPLSHRSDGGPAGVPFVIALLAGGGLGHRAAR